MLWREAGTLGAVRGLPIHFHLSLLPLAFLSTLKPVRSFGVLSRVSRILGDCPETFQNPRRPSGVSELHPIPFRLASPYVEAHHCTVPSHADWCTCFPAYLARFPQSILFGSSLARSVVYYSLCIILSYIFSLDPPLLA
jgi:hypothetical protein